MAQQHRSLSARFDRLLGRLGLARRGVHVDLLDDLDVPGLAPREVTVYLPPGLRRDRPAPLLIALDGQMMGRWHLAEAVANLIQDGAIEPPVIAAVPASPARIDEYALAGVLDHAGRGALAERFQNYLVYSLLPALRNRYAVSPGADRTGIFGASMGGLCALDTAWRFPEEFGLAGVFSGSLWWRADDSTPAAQQASRLMHRRVRQTARRPALRLWFQAGTADEAADRDDNGVIDAIQDTTELIDELVVLGFRRGADVVYRETPGGEHNEGTWAREMPAFLRWALPVRPGGT